MTNIIASSLCLIMSVFFFVDCTQKKLISVPDLRGLNIEDATQKIESLGLALEIKDETYATSVPSDYILAQVPFPFTEVKEGRSISVKISKGSPEVICPDLIGKSYGEAIKLIHDAGLHVNIIREVELVDEELEISSEPDDETTDELNDESVQEDETEEVGVTTNEVVTNKNRTKSVVLGTVLKQNPAPGQKMEPGQGIDLTIYLPALPTVPNLLTVHLSDAKYIIEHSGYTLGTITYIPNPNYPRGVVYQQEPIPLSPAEHGSSINLIVNEEIAVDEEKP